MKYQPKDRVMHNSFGLAHVLEDRGTSVLIQLAEGRRIEVSHSKVSDCPDEKEVLRRATEERVKRSWEHSKQDAERLGMD